jgi:hypothetical protein
MRPSVATVPEYNGQTGRIPQDTVLGMPCGRPIMAQAESHTAAIHGSGKLLTLERCQRYVGVEYLIFLPLRWQSQAQRELPWPR